MRPSLSWPRAAILSGKGWKDTWCSLHAGYPNAASRSQSGRPMASEGQQRWTERGHVMTGDTKQQSSPTANLPGGEEGPRCSIKKRRAAAEAVCASWATPEAYEARREAIQRSLIYHCPACPQKCARLEVMGRHLRSCCPDLVSTQEWEAVAGNSGAALQLLERLRKLEEAVREEILALAFRGRDSSGDPIRREPADIVPLIGLPLKRVTVALREGMKAVPLVADPEGIHVVYEDDDLLAVSKPSGIISAPKHRFEGGSLVNRVITYLGKPPFPVHRLDMFTTGVVIFAKNKDVVPMLHAQFRNQEAHKQYLALAVGLVPQDHVRVDAPIDRHDTLQVARVIKEGGLPSVTDMAVVARSTTDFSADARVSPCAIDLTPSSCRGATLVCCEPRTGRTHQIRLHLQHIGHPIVGDDLYGVQTDWAARQLLHAATLQLTHPRTGLPLKVAAPLPPDFQEALKVVGLEWPEDLMDLPSAHMPSPAPAVPPS